MIDQDHAMWLDSEVTRLSCALAKKERELATANKRIAFLSGLIKHAEEQAKTVRSGKYQCETCESSVAGEVENE